MKKSMVVGAGVLFALLAINSVSSASPQPRKESWLFLVGETKAKYKAEMVVTSYNEDVSKVSGHVIEPPNKKHKLQECTAAQLGDTTKLMAGKVKCSYVFSAGGESSFYHLVEVDETNVAWQFTVGEPNWKSFREGQLVLIEPESELTPFSGTRTK